MQDRALGAFLVVEDELYGDARAVGPGGVGRGGAVADEVAGVGGWVIASSP